MLRTLLSLEHILAIETEQPCKNIAGETEHHLIIDLNSLIIAHPLCCNAVFSAFKLSLQVHEILIGLQVGICLAHRVDINVERTFQRTLALLESLDILLRLSRSHLVGLVIGLSQTCTGIGNTLKCLALMGGISLDGVDKVGNQVGTALVLVLNLTPLLFNRLVGIDQPVILRAALPPLFRL